jgi:hypothetical protein
VGGIFLEIAMLKIDGHDDAIVGQACIWTNQSKEHVLVYSGERIVKGLMERDGMSMEEAIEYIDFNIEGAYMGPGTPIIMWEYVEE